MNGSDVDQCLCMYCCPSQESEFLKEVKVQEIIDVKQIVEVSKTSTMYVRTCVSTLYILHVCTRPMR